jgi:hypothetical protein
MLMLLTGLCQREAKQAQNFTATADADSADDDADQLALPLLLCV